MWFELKMTTKEISHSSPELKPSFIRFGTDGWRGIIAEQYTFHNVRLVSHAVAQTFRKVRTHSKKIFIGYDHRFLAEKFAGEVCRVFSSYRYEPCLLNHPVTSPFLSFVTRQQKSPFGVMITASHNPSNYLGFKVKASFGGSILQESAMNIEKKLSAILNDSAPIPELINEKNSNGLDNNKKITENLNEKYVQYLKKHIDFSLFKKKKPAIAFDALYGPAGRMINQFFSSISNSIKPQIIHNNRDPLFGALHPEPIEENLQDLKSFVRISKSSVGFALDGDGDRLGVVDEKGNYLTPQQVFALLLFYLLDQKKLKGKVVQTVSLGYLSERMAKEFNCPFEEIPIGFKYVADKILNEDILAGGEESGGYAFMKTNRLTRIGTILPERDGIFSALLLLEMIFHHRKNLSELVNILQKHYGVSFYLRKDIPLFRPIEDKSLFVKNIENKFPKNWLGSNIKEMRTRDGLKIILENGAWMLIRPSGTEPLLRTYAEFPNKDLTVQTLKKLSEFLQCVFKSGERA